jgi:hypothetical protein
MLSDNVLIVAVDDDAVDPAGPNVVGVVGEFESPHDTVIRAAPIRSAQVR